MKYTLPVLAILLTLSATMTFGQSAPIKKHPYTISQARTSPCEGAPVFFSATDPSKPNSMDRFWWAFDDGVIAYTSSEKPSASRNYGIEGTFPVLFGTVNPVTGDLDTLELFYTTVEFHCPDLHVTGSVYLDVNHNGLQDSGEPKIPHTPLRVTLADQPQANPHTLTTDENGDYAIDLPAGDYKITLLPIPNHRSVSPATRSLHVTSPGGLAIDAGHDFGVTPVLR